MKKKYAYILIIFLILIFSLLFFLFRSKEPELIRIEFDRSAKHGQKDLEIGGNRFQEINKNLLLTIKDYFITLKGVLILKENPDHESIITNIKPGLTGQYLMDFHLYNRPYKNKISYLDIYQKRNNKILKKIKLYKTESLKHYQILFQLKKQDIIEFQVNKSGINAISNPLFYKFQEKAARQMVFIIVADTLRWDHVGIFNPLKKCTPNIDFFSKDGVIFHQAYSTSPWTLPAHMSLFTSLNPDKHNINYGNERLNDNITVLFEILQKKFINYSFNDNTFVSGLYGFSRGFDVYQEANYSKWYFYNRLENSDILKNGAKLMFANAKKYVEQVKYKYSLFFLHTYQIHNPYSPEIELAKEYYRDEFNKFEFNPIRFIDKGKSLFKKVAANERKEIERIYDAGVYTFDYRFGEFIKFLKSKKYYHDATIILLSDHGEEFSDHGGWEHGHSLYNELIKIPLIIKFPGNRNAGLQINELVSICDILPTIFKLYDISHPEKEKLDGLPLLDQINGHNLNKRTIISYLAPYSLRDCIPEKITLFSENFKFIFHKPMSGRDLNYFKIPPPELENELYDIQTDPYEKHNIIQIHQKVAAKLFNKIKKLKFRKGKKGFLKDLENNLKTLGYLN